MAKLLSLPWKMKDTLSPETTLAKKAKHGDAEAFTELYKIHKIYLYKIAYSYIKDEHKALDILQDCAYKGFLNIHKLKEPDHFKTWITRIIINISIDHLKKNDNIVCLNEDTPLITSENSVTIEEKLDLYNAIDSLRENYKTVIILKYFNNLSINEISNIMDMPSNTIKSHLKRAKDELNTILKEDFLND